MGNHGHQHFSDTAVFRHRGATAVEALERDQPDSDLRRLRLHPAKACVCGFFCEPSEASIADGGQLFQNFFSPLRRIPSPLLNKLSHWPLTIATLKGTSHHFTHDLHQRYGRIVVLSPGIISVADAGEIRRIIKAEDWPKSHAIYGNFRQDPDRPTRDPYIDEFTRGIVDGRRRELASEGAEAKADLLQWLVKASSTDDDAGSEFRTSDVQDESVVLLTAGSETTANAELFTLLLLAKNAAALQRLYREVDEWYPVGSDRDTDCGYSLAGMVYLQACINEAMRLVPGQATGSPRETSSDETVMGYRLPKGTTVFPNTQEGHTDARLWDQPQRFMPERWLDGALDDAALAFWPFSAGSRVCIGKHFALQEMHLTLVTLLRHFVFEHVPDQDETTVFRVAQQLRAEAYWMRVSRRGT